LAALLGRGNLFSIRVASEDPLGLEPAHTARHNQKKTEKKPTTDNAHDLAPRDRNKVRQKKETKNRNKIKQSRETESKKKRMESSAEPLERLPRKLVAHVLDLLGDDNNRGDISVCMCLLASRAFHVMTPTQVWHRGRRLREASLRLDAVAAIAPPYLAKRLAQRRLLRHEAIIRAARNGNLEVVRCLEDDAHLSSAKPRALVEAIIRRRTAVVAHLATTVVPDNAMMRAALRTGELPIMDTIHRARGLSDEQASRTKICAEKSSAATINAFKSGDPATVEWLCSRAPEAFDEACALSAALNTCNVNMADIAVARGAHAGIVLCLSPPAGPAFSTGANVVEWVAARPYLAHAAWTSIGASAIEYADWRLLDTVRRRLPDVLAEWAAIEIDNRLSEPQKTLLADFGQRPDESLLSLLWLMQAGDVDGVRSICARRRVLGIDIDIDALYSVWGNGCREPAAASHAFDLAVAQAVGAQASACRAYAQAAACAGASHTLDWIFAHNSDQQSIYGAHCNRVEPDVVRVLLSRNSLRDPTASMVALVSAGHVCLAKRICHGHPTAMRDAAMALWQNAIRAGDDDLVERTVSVLGADSIDSTVMDDAAERAPLAVFGALARHARASGIRAVDYRCSRKGIAAAMLRLHGFVLAHMLDNERLFCAENAFATRTRGQRRGWRAAIADAAAKGMLDNAERVMARLGWRQYPDLAMDKAARSGSVSALAALHATGRASCSARAFWHAAEYAGRDTVDFLIEHRCGRPSTRAAISALDRNNHITAQQLIDRWPSVMAKGDVLIAAARIGSVDIVESLLAIARFGRRPIRKAVLAASTVDNKNNDNVVAMLKAHRRASRC
jgi:hypothetical protein